MEDDIIYDCVLKIERADDMSKDKDKDSPLARIIDELYINPKPKKEPTAANPFADFDFGDD